MKSRGRRPRRALAFAILMVASAGLSILPPAWTRGASAVLQPVAWLQHLAASLTRRAAGAWDSRNTPDHIARLERENQALRIQLQHQADLIAQLSTQLETVAYLGSPDTRIVIAPVIAGDARGRDTLRIGNGSAEGIRPGDWVAAAWQPDSNEPATIGVLRAWLIGQVLEAHPYVSSVRLLTDPGTLRLRVQLARPVSGGKLEKSPIEGLLYGLGNGRMEIREAPVDYVREGHVVVMAPLSAQPALSLTLGRVTRSEPVPAAPLFYNLEVQPWADARRVTTVFVIVRQAPGT